MDYNNTIHIINFRPKTYSLPPVYNRVYVFDDYVTDDYVE